MTHVKKLLSLLLVLALVLSFAPMAMAAEGDQEAAETQTVETAEETLTEETEEEAAEPAAEPEDAEEEAAPAEEAAEEPEAVALDAAPLLGDASAEAYVAKLTIGSGAPQYFYSVQAAIEAAGTAAATIQISNNLNQAELLALDNVGSDVIVPLREASEATTAYTMVGWDDERAAAVQECIIVHAGQNITLDLNGQVLMQGAAVASGFDGSSWRDVISNYGTLTVVDTAEKVLANVTGVVADTQGDGTLSGRYQRGTVANTLGTSVQDGLIVNYPGGNVTLTGVRLARTGRGVFNYGVMEMGGDLEYSTTMTGWFGVISGNWNSADGDARLRGMSTADLAPAATKVTVTGGMYWFGYPIILVAQGKGVISGGTFWARAGHCCMESTKSAVSVTMTGGVFIGTGTSSTSGTRSVISLSCPSTVSGVTILNSGDGSGLSASSVVAIANSTIETEDGAALGATGTDSNVTIEDTTLAGALSVEDGAVELGEGVQLSDVDVTGGSVTGDISTTGSVTVNGGTVGNIDAASVTVDGGTVTGTIDTDDLAVTGGVFTNETTQAQVVEQMVEDGVDQESLVVTEEGLIYDGGTLTYTGDHRLVVTENIIARIGPEVEKIYYESLQEAIDATDPAAKQTVYLEADSLYDYIWIRGASLLSDGNGADDLTLDLNGHILTNGDDGSGSSDRRSYVIGGNRYYAPLTVAGTLRLIDSAVTKGAVVPGYGVYELQYTIRNIVDIASGGSLTVGRDDAENTCQVVFDREEDGAKTFTGIMNGGTLIIYDAVVRGIRNAVCVDGNALHTASQMASAPPSTIIYGGDFYVTNGANYGVVNIGYGACEIRGGSFRGNAPALRVRNDNASGASITVRGGDFTPSGAAVCVIGTSEVPGGEIRFAGGTCTSTDVFAKNYGTLYLEDGSVTAAQLCENYGDFTVSGGTFVRTGSAVGITVKNGSTLTVSGGTLKNADTNETTNHMIFYYYTSGVDFSVMYCHVSGGSVLGSIYIGSVPTEVTGGTVNLLRLTSSNTAYTDRISDCTIGTLEITGARPAVISGAVTIGDLIINSDNNDLTMTGGKITGDITDNKATETAPLKFISNGQFSEEYYEHFLPYVVDGLTIEADSPWRVVPAAPGKVAGIVGGALYETMDQAIAEASSGKTILLYDDATVSSNAILSDGVELVLNGYDLTVDNYFAVFGKITDDSGGASVIRAAEDKFFLTTAADGAVPVYDSTAGGYRMASVSVQSADSKSTPALSTPEGTVKFAFRPDFITDVATAVADGGSKLTVGVDAEYNDQLLRFTYSDTLVTNAMNDATYALTLTVRGLGALSSIKFTPFVESAKAAGRYEADSVTVNLSEA